MDILHGTPPNTPLIIRSEVDVSCVLLWTQPVCMVQNQNTRNIYLKADDKRCRDPDSWVGARLLDDLIHREGAKLNRGVAGVKAYDMTDMW